MKDNVHLGELIYPKWYAFNAEIHLNDNSLYLLEPDGFWETTIQLKQDGVSLIDFKMGWKGIVFTTNIEGERKDYLLKLKGLFNSKYVLIDTNEKELIVIEFDFKWNKLQFDYRISTSGEFDNFDNKEILLLAILHGMNYYLAFMSGT